MQSRFRGELGDIIHEIEFYPNGDIRNITFNRKLRSDRDVQQYSKEFELMQRKFYDLRNRKNE